MRTVNRRNLILWAGDLAVVVILTWIGFATHDRLDAGSARIAATLVPLLMAWVFVALPAGILSETAASQPLGLLRAAWAMVLAGVLAAILRGLVLNRAVAPVFAIVLSGSSMLGILVWRFLYLLLQRKIN